MPTETAARYQGAGGRYLISSWTATWRPLPIEGTHPGMVQCGAEWCSIANMADTERSVRQSVSIPSGMARRVRALAKTRKTSANRVLVDLIEAGLQSKDAEKERFFLLVKRLTESSSSVERQRLKDELARMTFGD